MKKIILLIAIYIYCSNILSAQTLLQITEPIVYLLDSSSVVELRITAEINDISSAKSIHFLLSAEGFDKSDLLNINATIFVRDRSYFLQYNNFTEPILGNHRVRIVPEMNSADYERLKYLTIYAEDASGVATSHINVLVK